MSQSVAQRVAEVLAIPYSDSKFKQALGILDSKYPQCSNEGLLKGLVERDLLAKVGATLRDMTPLYEQLQASKSSIDTFTSIHEQLSHTLQEGTKLAAPLLVEAAALEKEKHSLEQKLLTATTFKNTVVISDLEATSLTDTSLPVDDLFFLSFEKLKLGKQAGLPHSELHLEAAYSKLKYCVETTLRSGRFDSTLRKEIKLLAEQPLLFQEVLSQLCAQRSKELAREFSMAYSPRTKFTGNPFTGDVLAWVHTAIVNEYDSISVLIDPDLNLGASSLAAATLFEGDSEIIAQLADMVTSALDKPLKQLLGQIIVSLTRIPDIDQIYHVVAFYSQMLEKYKQPTIQATLQSVIDSLDTQLQHCLHSELDLAKQTRLPATLESPEFLNRILRDVSVLLEGYETYPQNQESIKERLNKVFDPLFEQCIELAKGAPARDASIFILNCIDAVQPVFAGFTFAAYKISDLDKREEAQIGLVAEFESNNLAKRAGLHADAPLDAAVFENAVGEAQFTLEENLAKLASPRMANAISNQAMSRFIKTCETHANLPVSMESVRLVLG